VEKLGDDREYETQRNGVRYAVIERNYAIFPQQSGKLNIKPIVFEGQIVNRTRSVFDSFAQASAVKRLQSKPVELEVMPVPQNVQGSYWLPAQELRLTEEWPDPLEFKTGEPVTRTITLRAKGLTAAQLPEINSDVPDGIKLYPDQPSLDDNKRSNEIIGTRQEKIAMIPSQQGDFVLPAIEIPWWNTIKNRQEIARIPQRTIHVIAAQPSTTTASPANQTGSESPETVASGQDTKIMPVTNETSPAVPDFWFWVSVVLAFGWLSTVIWFFMIRKPVQADTTKNKERVESLSRIKRDLKQACLNDAANDAKTSLLDWARHHWQADPPKNLGEIGKRCGGYFANEINILTQALYSQEVGQWKGGGLWQAFEQYLSAQKAGNTQSSEILAPLYP